MRLWPSIASISYVIWHFAVGPTRNFHIQYYFKTSSLFQMWHSSGTKMSDLAHSSLSSSRTIPGRRYSGSPLIRWLILNFTCGCQSSSGAGVRAVSWTSCSNEAVVKTLNEYWQAFSSPTTWANTWERSVASWWNVSLSSFQTWVHLRKIWFLTLRPFKIFYIFLT